MPKKSPTVLVVTAFVLLLLLTSITAYLFKFKNQQEVQNSSEPAGKAKTEDIKVLELSGDCNSGQLPGVEVNVSKAYLVSSLADLPRYKLDEIVRDNPDIGADKFLVLQGTAKNKNTQVGNDQTVYASYFFRLRRGRNDSAAVTYGGPTLGPLQSGRIYGVFPVIKDEARFTLLYCNLTYPTILNVDFNSPAVQTVNGTFSIDRGFIKSAAL